MKTAWYDHFGPADQVLQVGDQPKPKPKKGEVLVRIYSSGVNPSDVKKRAGSNPAGLDEGPVIPHSDAAGIIEAVGQGVSKARIGERVWVYNAQYGRQNGAAAEYVSVPASTTVYLPANQSFEVGACMGIPVMTAHRCVMADGPVLGKTILVTGGAGRVGHYAIQIAKFYGARVIATASSSAGKQACYEAGADLALDHPGEAMVDAIQLFTDNQGVDRVVEVEFGKNLPYLMQVIKTGGIIATYASMTNNHPEIPFYPMMYKDLTIRLVIVYAMPEQAKTEAAKDIVQWLERDQLIHRIAHTRPLEQIAEAHELIEQGGFMGCVVVTH